MVVDAGATELRNTLLDIEAAMSFFSEVATKLGCLRPISMAHFPLPGERPDDVLSIAVVGNDTVLAALPAHPVQLAHGCHRLGYHTVVPASWGDELVATAVLRDADRLGRRPAVVCSCERARARLTSGAGELRSFLISTVAPPVAVARYLRRILSHRKLDITFIGDCASGGDPVFDARYAPDVFLVRLRNAGITLGELPTHFDNLVPPDRRRYASLPGGCPSADALERSAPDRRLVELSDSNFAIELAEQLVAQDPVLLDVAAAVGCSCAGVRREGSPRTARVAVTSLEPPRAVEAILDGAAVVDVTIEAPRDPLAELIPRDPDADLGQLPGFLLDSIPSIREVLGATTEHAQPVSFDSGDWVSSEAVPEPDPAPPPARRRLVAITPSHALRAVTSRSEPRRQAVQAQVATSSSPDSGSSWTPAEESVNSVMVLAEEPPSAPVATPPSVPPVDEMVRQSARTGLRPLPRQVPPPPSRRRGPWRVLLWSALLIAMAVAFWRLVMLR